MPFSDVDALSSLLTLGGGRQVFSQACLQDLADAFPREPAPSAGNLHSFIEVASWMSMTALVVEQKVVSLTGVGKDSIPMSAVDAWADI